MDEDADVIVVDDVEPTPSTPSGSAALFNGQQQKNSKPQPTSLAEHARHSARLRNAAQVKYSEQLENIPQERSTRSSRLKMQSAPKLKFKLSEKAAAQAPGMSFLGAYDRELDSDEEDLAFEEQFILRLPPGEDCEKLRKMVAAREVSNDLWFKFKDSRRVVFHIDKSTYSAKLVDLPCIIESQKTLDNKQMFKVADICQMLVVENRIEQDEPSTGIRHFNIDEFIWPHGITPPLHHVRKRRFRKRINRRTIESVEQEVERLLDEDAVATEIKYEVLDNVNPDLSDSEFIERDEADMTEAPTPAADAPTPGDLGEMEEEEDGEEGQDSDIDEELAAELDLALGDEEDEPDEDEDDDDDSDEDEDDDEDDEEGQAIKLLNEEIRDLQAAVAKKDKEISSSANPLIRKRFEDALKKLSADLEMKVGQRDEMREKQRMIKEGISLEPEQGSESEGEENEMTSVQPQPQQFPPSNAIPMDID